MPLVPRSVLTGASAPQAEAHVDGDQGQGQAVPGDRVLQVVVGQRDAGEATDRQPAGVRPVVRLDHHRQQLEARRVLEPRQVVAEPHLSARAGWPA